MDVPAIPRGGAALCIAGKKVPLKITHFDDQLLLNGPNFDAAFSGVRTDGSVVPLDPDGNIVLDKGHVFLRRRKKPTTANPAVIAVLQFAGVSHHS